MFCDNDSVVDDNEREEVEDDNDVEDTSGSEKPGVQLARLG